MSDRIAPGSTLIRNTLQKSLEGLAAGTLHHAAPVQLTASEFDDVRVSVQSKAEDVNALVVSIAGPSGALPAGAQEVAAGAYAQYATVRHTPLPSLFHPSSPAPTQVHTTILPLVFRVAFGRQRRRRRRMERCFKPLHPPSCVVARRGM